MRSRWGTLIASDPVGCLALVGPNVEVSVDETSHPGSSQELQSEQSIVRTQLPGGGLGLVVGYNDVTNQVDRSGSEPVLEPDHTLMGWSFSEDDGATWEPQPQMALPEGIQKIFGDPWLDTDGEQQLVYYVSVAARESGPRDAFVVARSDEGGLPGSWEMLPPVVMPEPGKVDKPSIAVSDDGETILIAYVRDYSTNPEEVWVRASYTGGDSWEDPVEIPDRHADRHTPIIRIDPVNNDLVLVTFQENDAGDQSIWLAGSDDAGQSFEVWSKVADNLFVQPELEAYDATLRNRIFHSFFIDPANRHCDVVYEHDFKIWFTSTADGFTWSAPVKLDPETTGVDEFQAAISASIDRVAVTYYRQPEGDPHTDVFAVVSDDNGGSWSSPIRLTQGAGEEVPFQPCVSNDTDLGYFGDYIGLSPMTVNGEGETLDFFAMWADSRLGCEEYGELATARHQHTMGALFQ